MEIESSTATITKSEPIEAPNGDDGVENQQRYVTEEEANELIEKAKQFQKLWTEFEENFQTEEDKEYYIISAKWLRIWKEYVSYDNVIENKAPSSIFGCQKPSSDLTSSLIETDKKVNGYLFTYSPDNEKHPYDIYFKQGIQQKQDYEIVNKKIWQFFRADYPDGTEIVRYAYTVPGSYERKVEVHLKRIKIMILFQKELIAIDTGSQQRIKYNGTQQVSNYTTVSEFFALLYKTFQLPRYYQEFVIKPVDGLRLWKMGTSFDFSKFFTRLHQIVKTSKGHDYKVYIKDSEYLDPLSDKTIDQLKFEPNTMLLAEVREQGKQESNWTFYNDDEKLILKCLKCTNQLSSVVYCQCENAYYCGDNCKNNDWVFHRNYCPLKGQIDSSGSGSSIYSTSYTQEIKPWTSNGGHRTSNSDAEPVENDLSVRGVCGLRNLGNTCYMASGLQCLSNTYVLTKYFLENKHKEHLNTKNPMGCQGQLALAYGLLMKQLWYGTDNSVAPWDFKSIIGTHNQQFQGYGQNDSHELIQSTIDALHEDVNLVKQKPYVEAKEYDESRNEHLIAMEQWQNFLLRNRSFLVDQLYGQFRSHIVCPDCQRVSITFDPFNAIQVPIPFSDVKKINLNLLRDTPEQRPEVLTITYEEVASHTLADLRREVAKQINQPADRLLFFYGASSYASDDILETTRSINLRDDVKWKPLFVRVIPQAELDIPEERRVSIVITHSVQSSYHNDPTWRTIVSTPRRQFFDTYVLLKDLHLHIFQQHKRFYADKLNPELSDRENYENLIVNAPATQKLYQLLLRSNSNGYYECCYCAQTKCYGCPVPYDENTQLKDVYEKRPKQGYYRFEFEIFYITIPTGYLRTDDFFLQYEALERKKQQKDAMATEDGEEEKKDPSTIKIQDCLSLSSKPEKLHADNTWYCSKCKEHKQAFKTLQIYKAPQILIISFKRFKQRNNYGYGGEKNNALIDFPQVLDMSDYVINHELPSDKPLSEIEELIKSGQPVEKKFAKLEYELYAVSNHYGGMGGGHYTAYAKNPLSQQWHEFDDSRVSQKSDGRVVSTAAYVVLYKRKE